MAGESLVTDEVRRIYQSNVEVYCGYHWKFEKDREVYRSDQSRPSWQSFRPCGSNDNNFGPEVTFGEALGKAHPDTKIYLIKYAHGGTSLGCEWQPNSRSSAFANYGDSGCQKFLVGAGKELDSIRTYKRFVQFVKWGLESLTQRGINAEFGGMLWFQGEADADGRTPFKFLSDSYEVNLPHFIQNIRQEFNQPNLPFALGKIKCGYTHADWNYNVNPLEIVRSAQAKTASTSSKVYAFDTMDLEFREDKCHFDTRSMMTVGYRFADIFKN